MELNERKEHTLELVIAREKKPKHSINDPVGISFSGLSDFYFIKLEYEYLSLFQIQNHIKIFSMNLKIKIFMLNNIKKNSMQQKKVKNY